MKNWRFHLAVGVTLAAAAIFLAFQPLGDADQYASVGSFLLSMISFALALRAYRNGSMSSQDLRETGRIEIVDSKYVQLADDAKFSSKHGVTPPTYRRRANRAGASFVVEGCGVVHLGDRSIIDIGNDGDVEASDTD